MKIDLRRPEDEMRECEVIFARALSPQVITETLYALRQNNRKVDIIYVITTRDGQENKIEIVY